jgi:antitoxin component YwqK of YwqJK toxin-antitoxin module
MFPIVTVRSPRTALLGVVLLLLSLPAIRCYVQRTEAFYANVCPHDGEVEEKYPNGVVAARRTCVGGKIEGAETTWFDNGVVRWEGSFVGGKRQGKWTFYDREGQVKQREEYENGQPAQRLQ